MHFDRDGVAHLFKWVPALPKLIFNSNICVCFRIHKRPGSAENIRFGRKMVENCPFEVSYCENNIEFDEKHDSTPKSVKTLAKPYKDMKILKNLELPISVNSLLESYIRPTGCLAKSPEYTQ